MDTSITPQVRLPRRIRRAQIEQVLCRMARNQESFAIQVWELFNSLGDRLDQHIEDASRIGERLWAIEHPRRRRHEE